jgi:hypothetical protein
MKISKMERMISTANIKRVFKIESNFSLRSVFTIIKSYVFRYSFNMKTKGVLCQNEKKVWNY